MLFRMVEIKVFLRGEGKEKEDPSSFRGCRGQALSSHPPPCLQLPESPETSPCKITSHAHAWDSVCALWPTTTF